MDNKEEKIWNKFWTGVEKNNYNTLTEKESIIIRNIYLKNIRKELPYLFENFPTYKKELPDNILLNGYTEYVIGNHGVYIEFSEDNLKLPLEITKGEEYRLNNDYYNIKYFYYNPCGYEKIKVYLQKNIVSYADYKIGFYYVSPYDIFEKVKQNSLFIN